ncbi:uncharacterized protein LOC110724290 [Chenopodium quinoa]|uniref:uncharacterized protein LOC110724290 n=1 Tax=Chenopodium quinoa TaxID=63459 RepID=UPI000B77290F|nr:uncharacterized protein LOC110724290 [Chenopodium quinoa]
MGILGVLGSFLLIISLAFLSLGIYYKRNQKMNMEAQSLMQVPSAKVINKPADGGITTLHMAALNGHFETVHLLLDLGAFVSEITVEDGTTIDLIVFKKKKASSSYIFSTNDRLA